MCLFSHVATIFLYTADLVDKGKRKVKNKSVQNIRLIYDVSAIFSSVKILPVSSSAVF